MVIKKNGLLNEKYLKAKGHSKMRSTLIKFKCLVLRKRKEDREVSRIHLISMKDMVIRAMSIEMIV